MDCFICGSPLFTENGEKYVCTGCKRVWKRADEDGWESEVREIELLKEPEIGDKYTDIVKPKENEPERD